jgi:sugar-specific transcriptional regulator TrmB
LSYDSIKKVLTDFGLTEKEVEIYIFLAKHGALRGGEISKRTNTHRGLIYRLLSSLQTKGLVESTLESPTRFQIVPFETVLDQSIKTKREEAALIETTKKELLGYWKSIRQPGFELVSERFSVIKGTHKIYSKIEQMIKETKNQLLAILTVPSLVRADQSGLLDFASGRFSKSKFQLRFLTHLSEQELKLMKSLIKRKTNAEANFVGRVPDLGQRPFPRMFIRDEEEILFFLKSKADKSATEQDDICLWTNSKEIVKAFSAVFEEHWHNATEISKKIVEIEKGITSPEMSIIKNSEEAQQKYLSKLDSAREEIFLLTSSEGLIELSKTLPSLKENKENGISVRVLAPITGENLKDALSLLKCCEVRHITTSYLNTTIVDNQHLFQFKNPPPDSKKIDATLSFENTFYTNDLEYVEKTRTMLNKIWKDSPVPTTATIDSLEESSSMPSPMAASSEKENFRMMKKVSTYNICDAPPVTVDSILDKIIHAEKFEVNNPYTGITRGYGYSGQAVIHPPNFLSIPDMMIHAIHHDKQSSYGNEDYMVVYLWLNTPKGFLYVPSAILGDVQEGQAGLKALFEGTPAGQNVTIVKKDEIRVQMQGNTLFAGWTIPIPLLSSKYVLPPSAILLEAYGDLKPKSYAIGLPSGFKVAVEQNVMEAFVTFYHSSSKYSGPGTEGSICREIIMTTFPPETS